MDADKLRVLQTIGYSIQPTCRRCRHSRISPSVQWGTCAAHSYAHQKHTESRRPLSVHASGSCPDFEPRSGEDLGAWSEFVQSLA